jgi:hypothetical protein
MNFKQDEVNISVCIKGNQTVSASGLSYADAISQNSAFRRQLFAVDWLKI